MDHFRWQMASKNTPRNRQNFGVEKTEVVVYQNDANISAKYNHKMMQQTAAKHVLEFMKKHVFAKG